MSRAQFFDFLREGLSGVFPSKKLTASQVSGTESILDAFAKYGDNRTKSLAYILATAYHEVGGRMQPVREGFAKSDKEARKIVAKRAYGKPKDFGNVYYGRGLVQLTHNYNYKETGDLIGEDLLKNPDLALRPDIASRILIEGIIDGRFNAKKKGIAHYLPDKGKDDLENARRTVNITDRWKLIGGYYKRFLAAIEHAGGLTQILISPADKILSAEEIIAKNDPEEAQSTEEILIANPKLRNLPKARPMQKAAVSEAALEKFSHLIPDDHQSDSVFVLGVRGYYTNTMGDPGRNDRGIYDDAIFVIEPTQVHRFNANTDPSRVRTGIASLKAPQVVEYRPGNHGISGPNPYPAFRQASICTVLRDNQGEDTDSLEDPFWINLHRGGINTTSSAGCQTIPPHQWMEFKGLVDSLLEKYNQHTFCYLLIEARDVPDEATVLAAADIAPPALPPVLSSAPPTGSPPLVPSDVIPASPTGDTINQKLKDPALAAILLLLAQKGATTMDTPNNESQILRNLLMQLVLQKIGKSDLLTPVNGALGKGIGNLLNGKKTGLGIAGLLVTSLLPVLFPDSAQGILQIFAPAVSDGADAATKIATEAQNGQTVLQSIFAALSAWGVTGKLEKWAYLLSGKK